MKYKNFNIKQGILKSDKNILFINSPNYSKRDIKDKIQILVIHCISLPKNNYSNYYVEQFFRNYLPCNLPDAIKELKSVKVSAHLYIKRTGKVIQFINFNNKAWHAGESNFKELSNINDYSIGIELEGADNDKYTQAQYDSLIKLTKSIMCVYPDILLDNIVGHDQIAPNRKTDPGEFFDWEFFKSSLSHH
tara:strand:- start:2629 stop:3201 length:573 start_codon:yes stop_codon:yes gene_type:complete